MPKVSFGNNKAISAITWNPESKALGVELYVPSKQDGSTVWYRPIGCYIVITDQQKQDLMEMLSHEQNHGQKDLTSKS